MTERYLVFRSAKARTHLCVCAARSEQHALKIARQTGLRLERTAWATKEPDPMSYVGGMR